MFIFRPTVYYSCYIPVGPQWRRRDESCPLFSDIRQSVLAATLPQSSERETSSVATRTSSSQLLGTRDHLDVEELTGVISGGEKVRNANVGVLDYCG